MSGFSAGSSAARPGRQPNAATGEGRVQAPCLRCGYVLDVLHITRRDLQSELVACCLGRPEQAQHTEPVLRLLEHLLCAYSLWPTRLRMYWTL